MLGTIRESLVEYVRQLTAPMFVLFDFKELGGPIYRDIVEAFAKGDSARF